MIELRTFLHHEETWREDARYLSMTSSRRNCCAIRRWHLDQEHRCVAGASVDALCATIAARSRGRETLRPAQSGQWINCQPLVLLHGSYLDASRLAARSCHVWCPAAWQHSSTAKKPTHGSRKQTQCKRKSTASLRHTSAYNTSNTNETNLQGIVRNTPCVLTAPD